MKKGLADADFGTVQWLPPVVDCGTSAKPVTQHRLVTDLHVFTSIYARINTLMMPVAKTAASRGWILSGSWSVSALVWSWSVRIKYYLEEYWGRYDFTSFDVLSTCFFSQNELTFPQSPIPNLQFWAAWLHVLGPWSLLVHGHLFWPPLSFSAAAACMRWAVGW